MVDNNNQSYDTISMREGVQMKRPVWLQKAIGAHLDYTTAWKAIPWYPQRPFDVSVASLENT